MQTNNALLAFEQDQDQISTLSTEVSSGSTLTSPGDDPNAWAQSMNFRQGIREYNTLVSNINFATGWDQATDSSLNQISTLLSQAQQTAISAQGASGMSDPSALVTSLDGVLQQMVSAANSQYGDQYIFSGTSGSTTPPFSLDDTTGTVTYTGDSGQINVRTDPGSGASFTVNLSGDQVFNFQIGGTTHNMIQEVWNLKQAIATGNTTTIQNEVGILNQASQYLAQQTVTTGSRLDTLQNQQSAITALTTDEQSHLSDLSDTNMAQTITQLQQYQTAYQAALQVTGSLDNVTLLNYLPT
jgi:flagellar hook-associated protein 3 FlgL